MPVDTPVRDVMTADVATLRGDQSVTDAADLLAERNIGAMPVVDESGKLVGLLRDDDLIASEARVHVPTFINFLGLGVPFPGEMHHLEKELKKIAGATVADVMDSEPPTITPDASIADLATLMHDKSVTHVPVVDADNKVVGIVARGDVVRFIARTT
jgi:CBS domain-containing protein